MWRPRYLLIICFEFVIINIDVCDLHENPEISMALIAFILYKVPNMTNAMSEDYSQIVMS